MSDDDTYRGGSERIVHGVEVEQINETRDTGDAVFRAESDSAEMTFIFPSTREFDLIVHTIRSRKSGGMRRLMDAICREYDCEYVRFSTPLSEQLPNKLNGFERVVETIPDGPMAGEPWECLDGHWNTETERGGDPRDE